MFVFISVYIYAFYIMCCGKVVICLYSNLINTHKNSQHTQMHLYTVELFLIF